MLGYSQSGRPITLRFLSLFEHRDSHPGRARVLRSRTIEYESSESRNGVFWQRSSPTPSASSTWTSDMSRNRLMWLAMAVALAMMVAYQTIGGGGPALRLVRRAGRHPHRRTGCRRAGGSGRGAAAHPWLTTTAGRHSVTPGPTTTPRPAVTTVVTPATTSSTATSSTSHMPRSSGAPTPLAAGTLHDPYTNATIAFVRGNQDRRGGRRSTTSCRWRCAWDLGARNWTDDMRAAVRQRPGEPARGRLARQNQDKGDSGTGAVDATEHGASGASTRCSSSRCCAATGCPSTRRRPRYCGRLPRPARRAELTSWLMFGPALRVRPMTVDEATRVASWRYAGQWSVYDLTSARPLVDDLASYYAVGQARR